MIFDIIKNIISTVICHKKISIIIITYFLIFYLFHILIKTRYVPKIKMIKIFSSSNNYVAECAINYFSF